MPPVTVLKKNYYVVRFYTEKDVVSVVPLKWMRGTDYCLWPPKDLAGSKLLDAAEKGMEPIKNWKIFPVIIMGGSSTYKKADTKLKEALITSCLESSAASGDDQENIQPSNIEVEENFPLPAAPPGWKGPQGARASRPTRKDLPTAKRKGGREAPPATRKGGRDAPAPAPARKGSREAPAPTGKEGPEGASAGTGQRHQALQKGAEGCVMDGFQTVALKVLLKVQEQNKEILEQNSLIIRQQNVILARIEVLEESPRQPNEPPPPELPRLPLETMKEFEEVEGSLQSATLRVALRKELSTLGGTTLSNVVRLVMERTVRKEIQLQFSLMGRKGKRSFKGTRLYDVVLAAVRARLCNLRGGDKSKEQEPTNTIQDIERALSKWLASAADREGGRQLRAAPKGRPVSSPHRHPAGSSHSGSRHPDGGACTSRHVGSARSLLHIPGPHTPTRPLNASGPHNPTRPLYASGPRTPTRPLHASSPCSPLSPLSCGSPSQTPCPSPRWSDISDSP
ncbi:uncharacterized protein LOC115313459 [Ixodes scapularis]|uniref:uncharacterized protein LOC115313459 n=1 Tax=Ixodes scapularis TaxID=6945 RepID=UPI001C380BF2|nr:uncharacterized protein LOC115313459 [Ixodes scapularis]